MPQGWREHWPLGEGTDAETRAYRDRIVHTLGNLTLVTGNLNPSLSNSAWFTDDATRSKRQAIAAHTVLLLNKELLNAAGEI
jgi:hypothetical protein